MWAISTETLWTPSPTLSYHNNTYFLYHDRIYRDAPNYAYVPATDQVRRTQFRDINSTWDGGNGRALQWGRFTASRIGATAATAGKARELDVVAARGCTAVPEPTGLPEPGTSLWLPTADLPSDHAPLRARVS